MLMADLQLIENGEDRERYFGIDELDSSRSIYALRAKSYNRAKWKEAVDFLTERAYEVWKATDAVESTLRAERNAAAVGRRQEI